MNDLLNNSWLIGTGTAIISGLALYYFFGIGKPVSKSKIKDTALIRAGKDIRVGRDIVITTQPSSEKLIKTIRKQKQYVTFKKKTVTVTDREPKNIPVGIAISHFSRIQAKISLINADNVKWRVGFRFIKESAPRVEYVFHVFQDSGSNAFHSRIVVLENGGERSPDIQKHHIGVEDTKDFELEIRSDDGFIDFYVDEVFLGKYLVPLEDITDFTISSWSHNNLDPITVIIDKIKVWPYF